jgi:hypothetical protein
VLKRRGPIQAAGFVQCGWHVWPEASSSSWLLRRTSPSLCRLCSGLGHLVPSTPQVGSPALRRVVSRKSGCELGAGWNRRPKNTGDEYISVSPRRPSSGRSTAMSPPRRAST